MLVYVSGPYRGDVKRNVEQARGIAIALWQKGHAVICPHANNYRMDEDTAITSDQFIAGDLVMIARCDALVMTPDWLESEGACIEADYAKTLGIPIYVYPDLPDLHLTEQRCPEQAKAFAEVVGRMYRTHLQKNADYSPANILLTGEVGLLTRLWDKVARLLNLSGFKLNVQTGTFEKPLDAVNEPLEDAYLDAAVYAIIGLLLRRGQWGR